MLTTRRSLRAGAPGWRQAPRQAHLGDTGVSAGRRLCPWACPAQSGADKRWFIGGPSWPGRGWWHGEENEKAPLSLSVEWYIPGYGERAGPFLNTGLVVAPLTLFSRSCDHHRPFLVEKFDRQALLVKWWCSTPTPHPNPVNHHLHFPPELIF